MNREREVTIDFVAKGESPNEWLLVLVEEGPWHTSIESELRRVQGRLYDCLDLVFDGKISDKFPETIGKNIVIRLDCYNLPRDEVEAFFDSFSSRVFAGGDYKKALEGTNLVNDVSFLIKFNSIN